MGTLLMKFDSKMISVRFKEALVITVEFVFHLSKQKKGFILFSNFPEGWQTEVNKVFYFHFTVFYTNFFHILSWFLKPS